MKTILTISGLMTALAVVAAPEGLVSKSASGSTSATVYFEPGIRQAALVTADVTSDKAASVLSWRVGAKQVTLLKSAAAQTNLTVTTGTVPASTNLVSVTADGTVTAHMSHSTVQLTNYTASLGSALGTNLAAAITLRELSSTNYEVMEFSSTNLVSVSTNNAVTAGQTYVLSAAPNQWQTNLLTSFTTNGANRVLNFTNAVGFTPATLTILHTNVYTLQYAASAGADAVIVDTTNGLAKGDSLVILAGSGVVLPASYLAGTVHYSQTLNLTATNGVNFALGDRLFVLDTAITTPVGAATLRLNGDNLRLLPANMPAVLSVDGTSACAVNAAIVDYGR